MTAPKPPDNKTLVGLPHELKAILERPRTAPPALPAFRELPALASESARQSQPPAAEQQPPQSKAAMDRTLIGIPSEMQAALERALAEQAAGKAKARPERPQPAASAQVEVPPTASESVLRVQAVRTIGVSSAPASEKQTPPSAARRSVPPQQLPPRPAPGRRSAPPQLPPRPQPRPEVPTPASQPPARAASRGNGGQTQQSQRPAARTTGQSQLTSQSELLAQSQITAAPFLAPNAPLDWPPAQRRSDTGALPRPGSDPAHATPAAAPGGTLTAAVPPRVGSQLIAAEPSVIVTPDEPERAPEPDHFARRGSNDPSERDDNDDDTDRHSAAQPKRPAFKLPPGSDLTKTKRTKAVVESSPKRWPAVALIALAVIAFGCVIVLRTPSLLPAPLAAVVAPPAKHGPGEGSSRVATAASAAETPVAVKPVETDTSAATNPALAPPSPTRPPASPPVTTGISAQLEKRAIERLLADDYPAAKQLYEKLRSAEPHRPEFPAMLELLKRAPSSTCGQPGQPACTGAAP